MRSWPTWADSIQGETDSEKGTQHSNKGAGLDQEVRKGFLQGEVGRRPLGEWAELDTSEEWLGRHSKGLGFYSECSRKVLGWDPVCTYAVHSAACGGSVYLG
jgi:hypothetical protein